VLHAAFEMCTALVVEAILVDLLTITQLNRYCGKDSEFTSIGLFASQAAARQVRAGCSLVAEFVAHLCVDLPRVIPVKAAEGQAVVDQQVTVRHVQYTQRRGKALPHALPALKFNSAWPGK